MYLVHGSAEIELCTRLDWNQIETTKFNHYEEKFGGIMKKHLQLYK